MVGANVVESEFKHRTQEASAVLAFVRQQIAIHRMRMSLLLERQSAVYPSDSKILLCNTKLNRISV